MNTFAERKALIAQVAKDMGREVYEENAGRKDTTPRTDVKQNKTKLCTVADALRRSG